MILVTTAGKVGSATARLIARRELPVRVLVRYPEKVADLAPSRSRDLPGRSGLTREHRPGGAGRLEG